MKVYITLCIALCLLLANACKQANVNDIQMPGNKYIEPVFLTFNEGQFRGILLGSSKEEVKEAESGRLQLKEEQDNHLFYELVFPKDSTVKSLEYADIRYFFKNENLDIITVEYYLNNENQLDTIVEVLSQLYNEVYGRAYKDPGGYSVWDITSDPEKGKAPIKYDIGIKKVKAPFADTYLSIEFLKY